jgi:hypothetical protein
MWHLMRSVNPIPNMLAGHSIQKHVIVVEKFDSEKMP